MKTLQKIEIAHLPTPIERLDRLSTERDSVRLLIKRDDQTGLVFGGNKTRKLEYLTSDARSTGARTLITTGAFQSNHCRQTAAAAARLGFECILVLTRSVQDTGNSDINSDPSGNLLLDKLLGSEFVVCDHKDRDRVLQETFEIAQKDGRRPYLIPYGGSNSKGAAAYVFAMEELQEQLNNDQCNLPDPDWIVFPSSSGGTQAGLVIGAFIFGFQGKVLGISVDEHADVLAERIATIANKTANLLEEDTTVMPEDILVNDDYLGKGYGIPSDFEIDTIRQFAQLEGILLDPVYTSRAASGMLDLIRKGFFDKGDGGTSTVLFWHTGGTPALFADRYRTIIENIG